MPGTKATMKRKEKVFVNIQSDHQLNITKQRILRFIEKVIFRILNIEVAYLKHVSERQKDFIRLSFLITKNVKSKQMILYK